MLRPLPADLKSRITEMLKGNLDDQGALQSAKRDIYDGMRLDSYVDAGAYVSTIVKELKATLSASSEPEKHEAEKKSAQPTPWEPTGIPTTLDTIEYTSMDESASDPFTEEGSATADRIIAAKQAAADLFPEIPNVFKPFDNWVTFESVENKAPRVSGTTKNAQSNNPATWVSYQTLCENIRAGRGFQGIGFVPDGERSGWLTAADIDNAVNGQIMPWAQRIIDLLHGTYVERTVSGAGLRAWFVLRQPWHKSFDLGNAAKAHPNSNKTAQIEIVNDKQYMTISRDVLPQSVNAVRELSDAEAEQLFQLIAELQKEYATAPATTSATASTTAENFDSEFKPAEVYAREADGLLHSNRHKATVQEAGRMHQEKLVKLDAQARYEYLVDWREKNIFDPHGNPEQDKKTFAIAEWSLKLKPSTKLDFGQQTTDTAPEKPQPPAPDVATTTEYAMSEDEISAELEKQYPVIPLPPQPGPMWDDSILYGKLGEITRKAAEYNESHPAGIYLDLIVSMGSIVGRGAHFRINNTVHYTNEFMVRVGPTSKGRKGGGRDTVDAIMQLVDYDWASSRTMSGFGSGEAVIDKMRDPFQQQVRDRGKGTGFKTITVPGVADKRLCVRAGEIAGTFEVASREGSLMSTILRDGWDGKPLQNIVKGKTEGVSNSAMCKEPHLSVSGDCTNEELIAKLPDNSAENGFGNRFIYVYVHRVKMCPHGGPDIDWSADAAYLREVIQIARQVKYVALTRAAEKMWGRMYLELSEQEVPGLAGKMTARAAAHIRRIALIFALVDAPDAIDLSVVVDSCHLKAARNIWDYCQQSAEYIFSGATKDQARILRYVEKTGSVTERQVCDEVFQRNVKMAWVKAQVADLVGRGQLIRDGENLVHYTHWSKRKWD